MANFLKTWHGWSRVFGMMSLLPIFFGVYQYWQFSVWANEQIKNGGFVCGTGIAMLFAVCAIGFIFFALCAIICGIVARVRLSSRLSAVHDMAGKDPNE